MPREHAYSWVEQTLPGSSDYARTRVQVWDPQWLALGAMYGAMIRCVITIYCIIVQRNTQRNTQCSYANLTFPVITQVKTYGTMM